MSKLYVCKNTIPPRDSEKFKQTAYLVAEGMISRDARFCRCPPQLCAKFETNPRWIAWVAQGCPPEHQPPDEIRNG